MHHRKTKPTFMYSTNFKRDEPKTYTKKSNKSAKCWHLAHNTNRKKKTLWKKLDIMKKKHHIQNAVSWQVSADGQRMIGHMILRKNLEGEDILGLKIVGGTSISSDRIGAMIEKVKRGSIADKEGHLKPGKNLLLIPSNCLRQCNCLSISLCLSIYIIIK